MGARGRGSDRPQPRPAGRAGARHLPRHRRRVRRTRGHLRPDRAGAGGVEIEQTRPHHLDAARVHHRSRQAAPDLHKSEMGRDQRREAGGRGDRNGRRRRRIYVHQQQGAGEFRHHLHGTLLHPQSQSGRVRRLHQQRAGRGLPRVRRAAGLVYGRTANGQTRRKTRHGPGGVPPEERAERRRHARGRHPGPGSGDRLEGHRGSGGEVRLESDRGARSEGRVRPAVVHCARARLRGGIQKHRLQFWLSGKLLGEGRDPRERSDRKGGLVPRGRRGGTGDSHRHGADGR
ncbi:MAG: hypothetical protein PGMFKBFP_02355 [Anaerolineales bacterium]|nr:hypothetical protein [Anaerolineales bacterium]